MDNSQIKHSSIYFLYTYIDQNKIYCIDPRVKYIYYELYMIYIIAYHALIFLDLSKILIDLFNPMNIG